MGEESVQSRIRTRKKHKTQPSFNIKKNIFNIGSVQGWKGASERFTQTNILIIIITISLIY
jgi:hypothetical protein